MKISIELRIEPKRQEKRFQNAWIFFYRNQVRSYDLTRSIYLWGRDRLLRTLSLSSGMHVLEVGCGTGSNLLKLAKRYPQTSFYGLDASSLMLKVGVKKRIRLKHPEKLVLRHGEAPQDLSLEFFKLDTSFDAVFFSYSLSMIDEWQKTLEKTFEITKPGGNIFVVDFWDLARLPKWYQRFGEAWFQHFKFHRLLELPEYLQGLENAGRGTSHVEQVFRRYAYLAKFQRH